VPEANEVFAELEQLAVLAALRVGALAEGKQILVSTVTAEAAGCGHRLSYGACLLQGLALEVVAVEWR
jgi:class 3 adenylate cyclase